MNSPAVEHSFPALQWKTLQRRSIGNFRLFDAEWIKRQHPINGDTAEFLVLHTPVWVNVIPITTAGTVVMVRQYRHGIDQVTLEFPGGVAAEAEDPAAAAMRECQEETGYCGSPSTLHLLGIQRPNPAFMSTRCLSYVWYGCQLLAAPQWDAHEVLEVVEMSPEDVDRHIATGQIQHSIILAAWTLFRLHALPVEHGHGGSDG
ncbi:MAG: DNA mismatch repair protein MutT [Candidatus Kapaibacterium sp.]|nr:MAG: DNA mismatch repair protein MutT [Candidatus Kapabacteria bacterium]